MRGFFVCWRAVGHICLHLSGLQTAGMPSVSNGILLPLREGAQGPFINIPSKEI